ncbi:MULTISPECIES: DUF1707 domain-containing protein [Corynebacterium]|uniref:DUF1707 domain-containing protein n=2 Tax=Corynebacterium glucuronolyticum TaxID=39791 RepID=A0AAX1L8P5_9CORY|nr:MULTISPECIES: DUF1707 domain-containing protein [Corynebacterium]EEI64323.1 hypothetical protein HMPREF0293_0138 [Corynebacterium glucuronolyticum ATCC 51866]MCT1442460.1 DUF1707 domain-containing protein [Corynebacterium glucuronolyticum]OFO43333.1 hypothetical protein HMPREF3044_03510 [Corynebacterium sp. HMSC073D01]QQU88739.1 DUF1707 domain-containing protein [Corynebacterium glucuronolyticum]QRP70377.1 DUF1707 domain-containing protein [Corynebacterium glucuronolyticum]
MNYRLSDEERTRAMNTLGTHFADGRLTLAEYEERVQKVAEAVTDDQVAGLFRDLPEESYTVSEIEEYRKESGHPKAGILGLSIVGGFVGAVFATGALDAVFVILPVVVFILLYVMKIGPDSWYMPSAAQLRRTRLRELSYQQKLMALEQKKSDQERVRALKNRALGAAEKFLDK